MLEQQLIELDLSLKQAKVYLASLELGKSTIGIIAKKAGLARTTTYHVLDQLVEKGICSTYESKNKTFYHSLGVQGLYQLLDQQSQVLAYKKTLLQQLEKQLIALDNAKMYKPKVHYFEGKDELKKLLSILINSKAKEIYEICDLNDVSGYFNTHEIESHGKKRRDRLFGYIFSISKNHLSFEDDKTKHIHLDQYNLPITADIATFGDKAYFANLKGRGYGILIDDKYIAQTLKSMFKIIEQCKCDKHK